MVVRLFMPSEVLTYRSLLVSLSVNPATIQTGIIGLTLAALFAGVIPALSIIRHSIIKAIWGD